MFWRIAADALVLLHLGFILFVLLGGLLLLRWPRLLCLHLPAVVWGIVVPAPGVPADTLGKSSAQDGRAGGI